MGSAAQWRLALCLGTTAPSRGMERAGKTGSTVPVLRVVEGFLVPKLQQCKELGTISLEFKTHTCFL